MGHYHLPEGNGKENAKKATTKGQSRYNTKAKKKGCFYDKKSLSFGNP